MNNFFNVLTWILPLLVIFYIMYPVIYPKLYNSTVGRSRKYLNPISYQKNANDKSDFILIIYASTILLYTMNNYYVHGAIFQELESLRWLNETRGSNHTIKPGFLIGSATLYFLITVVFSFLLFITEYFNTPQSWKKTIKENMLNTIIKHLIIISLIIAMNDVIKLGIAICDSSGYYRYKGFYGSRGVIRNNESIINSFLMGHGFQIFIISFIALLNKYKFVLIKKISKIFEPYIAAKNTSISPNEALRKITKLNELFNQGIIDQEEYDKLKDDLKKRTDKNLHRL